MAKVTYLIGAGASANALPAVANFTEELKGIINILVGLSDEKERFESGQHYFAYYLTAYPILKFLLEGCESHMSVDTFCKMLFLTGRDDEYIKAKNGIILFFELYRFFYGKYDKRYDAFFATILNKTKPRLPDTINVISWNYDCEFEKAFLNYNHPSITMEKVYEELNVFHKNNKTHKGLNNQFGIIKVNGTAGYYDNNKNIILGLDKWEVFTKGRYTDYEGVINILARFTDYAIQKKFEPMISFAWDDDYSERQVESEIIDAIAESRILVVIGYSFPYFNRKRDKHIFRNLCSRFPSANKKIYLQDLNPTRLNENVDAIKPSYSKIFFIDNVDQFYIPHELD